MDAEAADLARFLAGAIEARAFPHREHLRMAYALLQREEFAAATLAYANALRAMTARAGRPEAFNLTVTVAFLALIAQRLRSHRGDFAAFLEANPELLDRRVLARWYRPEQLASAEARTLFLLPDPPRATAP